MEQRESKNCRFEILISKNDTERDKKKLQNQLNHLKKSIDKKKEKGLDYLPSTITDKSGRMDKRIPLGKLIRITQTDLKELVEPFGHGDVAATTKTIKKVKGGKYGPPSLRDGHIKPVDNRTTILISNLSDRVKLIDLEELVKPLGHIKKLHLAKDRSTHRCKGFAYAHFKTHADASRAITHLNGYGYDHLILSVDWSTL